MDGYLLFSHGSVLCGAGAALERHAERLRARLGAPVEIGYLNYSEPTFAAAAAVLAAAGVCRIVITPYFLVPGYFVSHSLPDQLAPIRASYPQIEFVTAEPLGADALLADALLESAAGSQSDPSFWRAGYDDAASRCRNRPDCPLYGTARCPAAVGSADSPESALLQRH